MKIAIVIDFMSTDRAGTEGQVFKLLKGLSPHHEVELIVLRQSDWLAAQAGSWPWPVTVIELGGVARPGFFPAVLRLVAHLRRRRPDVVHTFFPIANIVGVIAARLSGCKAVLSSRRDYGYWITPGYLRATRFANRFVDRIVTNSAQVKRFTTEVESVPADRISVVYNGVDFGALQLAQPHQGLRAQLGIPEGLRLIGLVANYRPIKRHDTLLEAVAILKRSHPDVGVLLVGVDSPDDPTLAGILQRAQRLGLSDCLFRGQADGNIADFLSLMAIGVNSSDSEGLSNAVIEYMVSKLPVVVSNGGGNPDLIEHEVHGLVFPVGDAQALAVCLARLLDDEALRQRCVAAAALKTQDMTMPAMVRHHEDAYQRALCKEVT
jgi:glycosyltransferase involved in cell wall biosynthesis